MKKIPFILFSLILGAVILVGCGEWLAKRKAERDDAKKQAGAAKQAETAHDSASTSAKTNICNDTLKVAHILRNGEFEPPGFVSTIDRLYIFDTSKTYLIPNFNKETIFTCYRYLFHCLNINAADSFVLVKSYGTKDNMRYYFKWYNHGIPYEGESTGSLGILKGKPSEFCMRVSKIEGSHIPTISLREATLAMMKATYPTYWQGEADEWRRKYYVAHKHFPSDSLNPYRVPKKDPLAKFDWQIGKSDSLYMPEREIGTLVWYAGDYNRNAQLVYKFEVEVVNNFGSFTPFIVWVSAHTGAVLEQYAIVPQ